VLAIVSGVALAASIVTGVAVGISIAKDVYNIAVGSIPPTLKLPTYVLSPQEIFSNRVPMLDINFFNPIEMQEVPMADGTTRYLFGTGQFVSDPSGGKMELTYVVDNPSTASQIGTTIATWYNTLRTMALVGLLTVLVYIGIRIIISSTANEKAKYKSKVQHWLTAMCLLFVLHYIMAFSVSIVVRISGALASGDNGMILYKIDDDKTRDFIWGDKKRNE
jgi:hypothetical protein